MSEKEEKNNELEDSEKEISSESSPQEVDSEPDQESVDEQEDKTITEEEAKGAPRFDAQFQMSLLKLMIEEDFFCSQMSRYLGADKDIDYAHKPRQYKDKILDQHQIIFTTLSLQNIFIIICKAFNETGVRPTVAQLRQRIQMGPSKSETWAGSDELLTVLERIDTLSVHDDAYFRQMIETWVKRVKFMKGFRSVANLFRQTHDLADTTSKMQSILDNITKVNFEGEDIITLDDNLLELMNESGNAMKGTIPTGITDLDKDLIGGLPRESLITILAGTNVGKSMFCIGLGAQALKAKGPDGNEIGYKVLYVPLEGTRAETPLRFASCLAGVDYKELINNNLSKEDQKKVEHVIKTYGKSRLMIKNMMDFNVTIEQFAAQVREIHKEFKFDMLIVDYGQLLETQMPTEGHRHTMARVYRGLSALAREFCAVVISPVQATRKGQESQTDSGMSFGRGPADKRPVLRSSDISEAFEIARVSGVIISLNMTDDERPEGKLRVFLEKQRHGMKGKEYGLMTDYPKCNLITGNFYSPDSNMVVGEGILSEVTKGLEGSSEELDLSLALGQGDNDEKAKKLEKLAGMGKEIRGIQKKLIKLKDDMETEREENPLEADDPESRLASLKKKYSQEEDKLEDSKINFLNLFSATHPKAKVSDLDTIEAKLDELSKNRKTTKMKEAMDDLQMLFDMYQLWIELEDE